MKTPFNLRAPVQSTLIRFLSFGLIAFLLVAAVFAAQPVGKAAAAGTCTNKSDGNWSNAAIWSCGHVPTSADDVVIDNTPFGVTINADQSVHSLTITNMGVLGFTAPANLTISGTFSVMGIFDPGSDATGGTVVFAPGSETIKTNGSVLDFWNLTKVAVGAGESLSVDPAAFGTGRVHVLNNLSLKGTAANHLLVDSTVPGAQWQIDPAGIGTPDVNYLDIRDSNNVSDSSIAVSSGVDQGNNNGLLFNGNQFGVRLLTSVNPISKGQPVTFTATLTTADATNTITFMDGDTTLCSEVALVDGVASCTVNALASGMHSITAVYSGDALYPTDTSGKLVEYVPFQFFLPVINR